MFELATHLIENEEFGFLYEASVNGVRVTGQYVTKQMAIANALCWMEFHGDTDEEKDTYEIDDTDRVVSMARRNGVHTNDWSAAEFMEFLKRQMNNFPETQIRVGREDSQGHKAKGRDFFVEIRNFPGNIRTWTFIVRRQK